MRYIYTVTEPNNGNQEKVLKVGKRTSEEIDSHLGKDCTLLMVQRFGLGLDTPDDCIVYINLIKSYLHPILQLSCLFRLL
jgi:hypothetical protein